MFFSSSEQIWLSKPPARQHRGQGEPEGTASDRPLWLLAPFVFQAPKGGGGIGQRRAFPEGRRAFEVSNWGRERCMPAGAHPRHHRPPRRRPPPPPPPDRPRTQPRASRTLSAGDVASGPGKKRKEKKALLSASRLDSVGVDSHAPPALGVCNATLRTQLRRCRGLRWDDGKPGVRR